MVKHTYAVNLESEKHIATVSILEHEELESAVSTTLVYMFNYVRDFIAKNNGLEHFRKSKLLSKIDLNNVELRDGYYYVKDLNNNKYVVYNIETKIQPGYFVNGVDRNISMVFELYANKVGEFDNLNLNKEINYGDVMTELNAKLSTD